MIAAMLELALLHTQDQAPRPEFTAAMEELRATPTAPIGKLVYEDAGFGSILAVDGDRGRSPTFAHRAAGVLSQEVDADR